MACCGILAILQIVNLMHVWRYWDFRFAWIFMECVILAAMSLGTVIGWRFFWWCFHINNSCYPSQLAIGRPLCFIPSYMKFIIHTDRWDHTRYCAIFHNIAGLGKMVPAVALICIHRPNHIWMSSHMLGHLISKVCENLATILDQQTLFYEMIIGS